ERGDDGPATVAGLALGGAVGGVAGHRDSSVSKARQRVQRGRGSSTAAGRVKGWSHGAGPPGRTRNDARPAWDETPPITPPSASSGRGRRSTRHGAGAAWARTADARRGSTWGRAAG